MTLSADLYRSLRQDIETEFEARRRELEDARLKAIEVLNEAWPKMGGSEQDVAALAAEVRDSLADEIATSTAQDPTYTLNGSSVSKVSTKAIREEIESLL